MKRMMICTVLAAALCLTACGQQAAAEPEVVQTYEVLEDEAQIQQNMQNGVPSTMIRYYELSDGTWKTDEHSYQYRLVLTGRSPNAEADSTFVVLSNVQDITFEQASLQLFSSNSQDFFDKTETVLVALG